MWADGKTLYKKMQTTRLGEGLDASGAILPAAAERTALAVAAFAEEGKLGGADEVCAFGTAAVRSAANADILIDRVRELCGVEVDVVSGEREAALGLSGALGGRDGGIIDVGGASTEISVRSGRETVFSRSYPVGTVRIFDAAGRNLSAINDFIASRFAPDLGDKFAKCPFFAIGGTASRLGAIKNGLKVYDSSRIHGTALTLGEVENFAKTLTSMPVEEIVATTVCGKSAEVVGGGAALLSAAMRAVGVDRIVVSESDNLEGYIAEKFGLK